MDTSHTVDINTSLYQDDEFNVFLFTLFSLFICGLFGAAVIGALVAALLILFLFFLTAFGFFSIAIAIGIYKRSFNSGFTSLLMLVFGTGCSIIGCVGFLFIDLLFHLPANRTTTLLIGLTSGAIAGIMLGKISAKLIQLLFSNMVQKLKGIAR